MQLNALHAIHTIWHRILTSLDVLVLLSNNWFSTTSWKRVGINLPFSLKSDLKTWLGIVVFDELDVFNGPCQTDSLVAYLDWHMDLGYLGQMIYYQSASRGQSGQSWPPQYDTSSDNKANARNYKLGLFWTDQQQQPTFGDFHSDDTIGQHSLFKVLYSLQPHSSWTFAWPVHSWHPSKCWPPKIWQTTVSLLDVQSHLKSKNVDG